MIITVKQEHVECYIELFWESSCHWVCGWVCKEYWYVYILIWAYKCKKTLFCIVVQSYPVTYRSCCNTL